MKPKFQHDCDSCTFLGHLDGHDVYRCLQGGRLPTLVARYGDGGPEYTSGEIISLAGRTFHVRHVHTAEELFGPLPETPPAPRRPGRTLHDDTVRVFVSAAVGEVMGRMLDTPDNRMSLVALIRASLRRAYERHDLVVEPEEKQVERLLFEAIGAPA